MSTSADPQDNGDSCKWEPNPAQQEEYNKAVATYEEIVERGKQLCEDFTELAVGHADRGEHERAIAVYDMMIRLIPDEAMTYRARGCSHRAIGNRQQAIADLSEAFRLDPDYSDACADLDNICLGLE